MSTAVPNLELKNDTDLQQFVMFEGERYRKTVLGQEPTKKRRPAKKPGQHALFNDVVGLAKLRMHTLLVGPAGCGKTHLAEQVADHLGLPFYLISCSAGITESSLLGTYAPTREGGAEWNDSVFVKAFERGGLVLFDEIDGGDSNVLLSLNAPLANKRLTLPKRYGNETAIMHDNFVFVAAANTFGRGADRQYAGRNRLDASSLDRFRIGTLEMNYDEDLELGLCPNEKLLSEIYKIRKAVFENRLEQIVSTRFIIDAYNCVEAGLLSISDCIKRLTAGWTKSELQKAGVA